ncbi:hypothetical protein [Lacticaseibacillus parakribbianus]|uniref:hypothetical protein n=1 Tax=Lacticaseibacillus parakribbianus TaxID=2970927 RepID=UPI0021CB81D0|nr:hypothetical protein [Lacticaseibacillus parakribbianus]
MAKIEINRVDLMAVDSKWAQFVSDKQRTRFDKMGKMNKDAENAIVRAFLKGGYSAAEWSGRGKQRVITLTEPDADHPRLAPVEIDKRLAVRQPDYIGDVALLLMDYIARNPELHALLNADSAKSKQFNYEAKLARAEHELRHTSWQWAGLIGLRPELDGDFDTVAEKKVAARFLGDPRHQTEAIEAYHQQMKQRYAAMFTSVVRNVPVNWSHEGHGLMDASVVTDANALKLTDSHHVDVFGEPMAEYHEKEVAIRAKYRKLRGATVAAEQIVSYNVDELKAIQSLKDEYFIDSFWMDWAVSIDQVTALPYSIDWIMDDTMRQDTVNRARAGFQRYIETLALNKDYTSQNANMDAYAWNQMSDIRSNGVAYDDKGRADNAITFLIKSRQWWQFNVAMNKANGLLDAQCGDLHDKMTRSEMKKAVAEWNALGEVEKMAYPTVESWLGAEVLEMLERP